MYSKLSWSAAFSRQSTVAFQMTSGSSSSCDFYLVWKVLENSILIGSMYGIFTQIYHKNQPNVGKYTSLMDPMGYKIHPQIPYKNTGRHGSTQLFSHLAPLLLKWYLTAARVDVFFWDGCSKITWAYKVFIDIRLEIEYLHVRYLYHVVWPFGAFENWWIAEVGSAGRGNSLGRLGERIVFCEVWAKLKRTKAPLKTRAETGKFQCWARTIFQKWPPWPWGVFFAQRPRPFRTSQCQWSAGLKRRRVAERYVSHTKKGPMVVWGGNFSIGKVTTQVSPLGLTQYNLGQIIATSHDRFTQKVAKEGNPQRTSYLNLSDLREASVQRQSQSQQRQLRVPAQEQGRRLGAKSSKSCPLSLGSQKFEVVSCRKGDCPYRHFWMPESNARPEGDG